MKSLRHLFSLVAAVATVSILSAAPHVGKPAPDFSLTDLQGKSHTLSSFRGKTVVLEWVNPECPIVRKHYDKSGNLPATQRAAVADGVVWLLINSGHPGAQGDFAPDKASAWMQKHQVSATAYFRDQDGKVGKLYDARTTPHLFIIDPAGVLVYAGGIDSISSGNPADIAKATNYVTAALADLKAGRPVAQASTRPYGCGIKYAD